MSVEEAIKSYIENITYKPYDDFTYNYRVEKISDDNYEVYIINSFAEIIYTFEDVKSEEYELGWGYSAIVGFSYCKITPFEADSNTEYFVDKLNKYIERCELVSSILDSVDVSLNPDERVYF